jgi:rSAM/selenodomain-associated transferase 1
VKHALIVVAKEPVRGRTKTRLCPPFTPASAAAFYRCLLLDTLALMAQLGNVDRSIAYMPSEAGAFFREIAPNGFHLVPQQGTDLGERLSNALGHHLELGYRRVVIMNSDGPTLPRSHLEEAFSGLDRADVTLGPSRDGGYYLIGLKQPQPELFQGIAWSTGQVTAQTLAICRRLGLGVHLLPEWYDVDVAADLQYLRRSLAQDPTAAPHTRAFLRRWDADSSGAGSLP